MIHNEAAARRKANCMNHHSITRIAGALAAAIGVLLATACQPTVKLEAPDKPITINLNVRVQIEREVEDLIQQERQRF